MGKKSIIIFNFYPGREKGGHTDRNYKFDRFLLTKQIVLLNHFLVGFQQKQFNQFCLQTRNNKTWPFLQRLPWFHLRQHMWCHLISWRIQFSPAPPSNLTRRSPFSSPLTHQYRQLPGLPCSPYTKTGVPSPKWNWNFCYF